MQVPTLRLKALNELFNNNSSSIEKQDDQREIANQYTNLFYPKDVQNLEDISNDVSWNDNNDEIIYEDEVARQKERMTEKF